MSVQLDTYMERLGEVFINALAGFFNNPAAGLNAFITNNPTLNTAIAVSQSTGPVGTTGNTGGP